MLLTIYHFDIKKPRKRQQSDTSWKKHYAETYYAWQLQKHGQRTIDTVGYVLIRDYPRVHTHKGLEQAADNYIKWKGGTVIDTPTIGTPRFEKQMVGSKMVSTQVGWMRAKGGQGKQDACWVYKGVVLFIDYKVGADFQKPEQAKVQARIERSGGTYLLIHNMQEVYDVIRDIDEQQ